MIAASETGILSAQFAAWPPGPEVMAGKAIIEMFEARSRFLVTANRFAKIPHEHFGIGLVYRLQ